MDLFSSLFANANCRRPSELLCNGSHSERGNSEDMKRSRSILSWAAGVLGLIVIVAVVGILWLRRENLADVGPVTGTLVVTSADFADGGKIPEKFACDAGISPALAWSQLPTGTRSIALIVEDPDAPFGFIHWVVYGLPGDTRELPDGASSQPLPGNARVGKNGYGGTGYVGPCPPFGSHHYIFRVYAVDKNIEVPAGASKQELIAAITGHVLAKGKLVGIYGRKQEK